MIVKQAVKRIAAIIVAVGLTMISSACSGVDNSSDAGGPIVRVGYFPNITHAQALVGLANSYFDSALGPGVNIEARLFNAGPSEIEALLADQIDIGYIGPGPAVNGFIKSKGELKIVAGAVDGGAILVSREDLPIGDLSQLSGKKVAVPQFGNTQDITLRYVLRRAGLKVSNKGGTVMVMPMENPVILTMMTKDEIDAALVPEPWGSRLIKETSAKVVLDADEVWPNGEYPTTVVIVRKEFLEQHRDLVEKWITAHVELTDYINQNPNEAREMVDSKLKELTQKSLGDDILKSSFDRLTVTYDPEVDAVREFVDILTQEGYIKAGSDVSGLFDLSVLDQVLEGKGKETIQQ